MKTGWKKYAVLQVNGTLGLNHVDLFGISPTVQEKFNLFQEAISLLDDSTFYFDIILSTMKISNFNELGLKQNGNLKYQLKNEMSIIDWELQQNLHAVFSLERIQFLQKHFQVCDNLEDLFALGILREYLLLEWILKMIKIVNLAIHGIFNQISGIHKGQPMVNLSNFFDVFGIFTKNLNAFYKHPFNYFNVFESTIYHTKDCLMIRYLFPIPEMKHFEKIFTMQPLTVLDPISENYRRVKIDKIDFVIRKNLIFEIKQSFLSRCKSFPHGIMSCEQNGLFHSWTPCLEALYYSNHNDSKPCLFCQRLTDPRKNPVIERLNEKEIHFALKFSVSVTINCEDGKYYTGEIFKGSGIMRVKTGCQLSSSFFSFKGDANQTDTLRIIYDKRNHSCTEKKIVLRNQCGFYDVHIYIKILPVIIIYNYIYMV